MSKVPVPQESVQIGEGIVGKPISDPKDIAKILERSDGSSLVIPHPSSNQGYLHIDLKGLDMDALVWLYNRSHETSRAVDLHLTGHLLNDPWLRAAIGEIEKGVVVEIGSYKGVTLEQLATKYAAQLSSSLVVGIDRGWFARGPDSGQFYDIGPEALFSAEPKLNKSVFNIEQWTLKLKYPGDIHFYQHREHPNTFAVYGVSTEDALIPNAELDLVLLKCMLGYFRNTPAESLEYLREVILPRAQRLFMVDYIRKVAFNGLDVPRPEDVVRTVKSAFSTSDVHVSQGKNHFVLYASR